MDPGLTLADAFTRPEAEPDGDGPGLVPLTEGCGLGLWPEDWLPPPFPTVAKVCAVLAKSVAMPNAVTALSSIARHVNRDNRRNPESRPARRFRCLMG